MRRLNIRIVIYLDDMLLLGRSIKEVLIATDTMIFLLQHPGFAINLKNSILTPQQKIELLGLLVDSLNMSLSFTPGKLMKVNSPCLEMYKTEKVSILQLTKLIGLLSSTAQAVLPVQRQFQLPVKLVLSSFTKNREIRPIHFQIDNTTALRYLAKMRGATSLEMIKLSKEIRDYLLSHGITINTDHLPSKLNVIADRESREKVDSSEKKLYLKVFQRLVQLTGNPVVHLFASRLNHHLPQYVAWRFNPFSQGTDAMHHDWSLDYLYAFLSFCLISRILQKVGQERTPSMLLITPTWHTQSWYPSLLQMSTETPVILPRINIVLKDPLGKHPLITNKTLRLAAWKTSGKHYLCQGFREQLPVLLLTQGEVHLQEIMNRSGETGLAGVVGDKLIQFRVL